MLENFLVDNDDNFPRELKDRDLDDKEKLWLFPDIFVLGLDVGPVLLDIRFCFKEFEDKDFVRDSTSFLGEGCPNPFAFDIFGEVTTLLPSGRSVPKVLPGGFLLA